MQASELKILLCDDSILARKQLHDVLMTFGCCQFQEAKNGEEALELYSSYHPDLVFLDIVMPKLDGISVIRKIKEDKNSCPIIMVSSVGTKEQLTAAIEAGAKDFIQKPFHTGQIEAVIHSITEGRV